MSHNRNPDWLSQLLSSGFVFSENETQLEFKFKTLNSIMMVAIVFAFLFALLHDLQFIDMGPIHSKVDYVYSATTAVLLIILRKSKTYYTLIASLFMLVSLATFVSALNFVLNDEFRVIWFYFVIYVTYVLLGTRAGMSMTLASIAAIIISNSIHDLHISETATVTAILGLLVASLLSRIYTLQMSRYEKQLETNINTLDKALDKAQEASKAKSLFLANMSHEIRTPLNGVLGMAQVMRGTTLDEQQRYYIDTISRSGKNLLFLLDELLDLSKIESGKVILEPTTFSTQEWITDIQDVVEPLFEETDVVFETELNDDIPLYLKGDATRLLQIVVNLVNNAAKYTNQGEVKLSIGGHSDSHKQFELQVSVKDTGIGIEADKVDQIFESFQQLESDRISNKGVGLGLAICKKLSDAMTGHLQVESIRGKGSHFSFSVNLQIIEKEVSRKKPAVSYQNNKTLNILLVDDDRINRLAVSSLLKQNGHNVIEASNGEEAIDKLPTGDYDAILMDVHMPVMDGITATRKIRSNGNDKTVIIGLTASVMNDEIKSYLDSGMNAVVEKPVVIEKLLNTIHEFL